MFDGFENVIFAQHHGFEGILCIVLKLMPPALNKNRCFCYYFVLYWAHESGFAKTSWLKESNAGLLKYSWNRIQHLRVFFLYKRNNVELKRPNSLRVPETA